MHVLLSLRRGGLGFDRLVMVAAVAGVVGGCADQPLDPITHHGCVGEPEGPHPIALVTNDAVDILFVIDDSASMDEEQAVLATNLESFVRVLERPGVDLDYRIGITTTDVGNPACQGSSPEVGALLLRSCRDHLEDFVGRGDGSPELDAPEICRDVCPEPWSGLATLPTTTEEDDTPRPRPWIERIAGRTNLPEGLDTAQALQCIGPQGIAGCEFESPLEAMDRALRRSFTDGDPAFGFVRDHAVLLVVIVTDEDDCSSSPAGASIFLPEGEHVFWSDPTASEPTSAVCWNASVECSELEEGKYEECHAVDRDVEGNAVAEENADALAVLGPLSGYADLLQGIEDQKQRIFPEQQVLVSLLAGVNSDGSVSYASTAFDPAFERDFGIGPGCQSQWGRAAPPVRLRELAEAFQVGDQRNTFSICEADYSVALEAVAERLAVQIRPMCLPDCAADADPSTSEVDPSCILVQDTPNHYGAFEDVEIPKCVESRLSAGQNVCYTSHVGDELDDFCQDSGYNLEFRLVRREGVYVPPGTVVRASCALSGCAATDCPELP
jgi:hypothetical protein